MGRRFESCRAHQVPLAYELRLKLLLGWHRALCVEFERDASIGVPHRLLRQIAQAHTLRRADSPANAGMCASRCASQSLLASQGPRSPYASRMFANRVEFRSTSDPGKSNRSAGFNRARNPHMRNTQWNRIFCITLLTIVRGPRKLLCKLARGFVMLTRTFGIPVSWASLYMLDWRWILPVCSRGSAR